MWQEKLVVSFACVDEVELEALAAGRIDGDARERVEQHVADCPSCAGVLAALVRAQSGMSSGTSDERNAAAIERWRDRRLGRHELLGVIGRGQNGIVFAAHDPTLGRRIAIKVVRDGHDETRIGRLLQEAQALARIQHPNVVTVHDVGVVDGDLFVAMDLVDGGNLREWLRERRSAREVLGLFVAVARGLAAIHAAGLLHRDIKPENILVTRDGRPRVGDLGLARRAASDEVEIADAMSPSSPVETMTGAAVGTPAYMAPEQRRGAQVDARADQFSFFVTLTEALTGTRPAALAHGAVLPTELGLGRGLRRAIARGLAEDPAARYPAMADVADVLQRLRRGTAGRVASAAMASIVVGAAIAGYAAGAGRPDAATDPGCAADPVAEIWTDERRDAVARGAMDAGPKAIEIIDGFAARWGTVYREACARELGVRRPIHACLDRGAAALDAVLEVAAHSRRPDVGVRLVEAALDLPAPFDCRSATDEDGWSLPADADGTAAALATRLGAARAHYALGDYATAQEIAPTREQIARLPAAHPLRAEADLNHARIARGLGAFAEARGWGLQAARTAARAHRPRLEIDAWIELVNIAFKDQRFEEAADHLALARGVLGEMTAPDDSLRALVLESEALVLTARGRRREAAEAYEAALALRTADPDGNAVAILADHQNLCSIYHDLGDLEAGGPHLSAASGERIAEVYGADHPRTARMLKNDAQSLALVGRKAEAMGALARAVAIYGKHPLLALEASETQATWADALLLQGRRLEALYWIERALLVQITRWGADDDRTLHGRAVLGRALAALGRNADAQAVLRAILVAAAAKPQRLRIEPWIHTELAGLYARDGDTARAEAEYRAAVEVARTTESPTSVYSADMAYNFAVHLSANGKPRDALEQVRASLAALEASGASDVLKADAQLFVAELQLEIDGHATPSTRALAEAAHRAFVAAGDTANAENAAGVLAAMR